MIEKLFAQVNDVLNTCEQSHALNEPIALNILEHHAQALLEEVRNLPASQQQAYLPELKSIIARLDPLSDSLKATQAG